MTENYYRTGFYKVDHSTFGGEICKGDFDIYHSLQEIADEIAQDWRFDAQCRKNRVNRDRYIKNSSQKGDIDD